MEELDFTDLPRKSIRVKYASKWYVLLEPSSEAAVKYRNFVLRATKPDADGRPTQYGSIAEAEPMLVGDCLCEEEGGTEGVPVKDRAGAPMPVGEKFARSLPNSILRKLFDWAMEAGGILKEQDSEDRIAEEQRKLDARREALRVPEGNSRSASLATFGQR